MADIEALSLSDFLAERRGNAARLARELKVKPQQIGKWARGDRPVPEKRAVRIEQLTGGRVPRRLLRPSDWFELWPEIVPPDAGTTPDLFAHAGAAM